MRAGQDDDLIEFVAEAAAAAISGPPPRPWRILVVDDDVEVHQATAFAIDGLPIQSRPVELLNAYSAHEALDKLRRETDIAVILLDVVMESPTAGLDMIPVIRNQLGLTNPRIILRTGQPGYAPEIDTIQRYDINDYKTKGELTRTKLFATLSTALRTYDQLCRIEAGRSGLEEIIRLSRDLLNAADYPSYVAGALRQIARFLGTAPDGLICAAASGTGGELSVIAGSGRYHGAAGRPLAERVPEPILSAITHSLTQRRNLLQHDGLAFCLPGTDAPTLVGYQHVPWPREIDGHLLEVFSTNLAIGAEKLHLLERLHAAAYTDSLTGLPNRSALMRELAGHADRAVPGQTLALLDLDQFSAVNDMFGHVYGDRLLCAIARHLGASLAPDCFVARVGNDTFAILGPRQRLRPDALHALIAGPYRFDDLEHSATACIGLVEVGERDAAALAEAFKDAWIALKRAKAGGQGQNAWFTAAVGAESRGHTRMLHALRRALNGDRLTLAYQPQIELASGRVLGVEALLRWQDEAGQAIAPDRFIPVAESSGLIVELGEWVLHTALCASDTLRRHGHDALRMAVNVSAIQCAHAGFIELLEQALAASSTPPQGLELEITESVALLGADAVERLLHAIKQRGISVAIDDFGTGYSSLAYLYRLPVDCLKIDRAFVHAMHAGLRGSRLAEMIVPLGRQLDMRVLAEGVETRQQAERLRQLGCHAAQGYLFARPMPLDDLLVWLAGWRGLPPP